MRGAVATHDPQVWPAVSVSATRPATPRHSDEDKAILGDTYTDLNPAAIKRQIRALTGQLLTLTTSKAAAAIKPVPTRASTDESTNPSTGAS